jgi:2,4-dienoyl-CoA reductase-like NADH-dependent reductase (Old Yellow Enzyme family)
VQRIVFSIRPHVPSDFVLGIKINSADYVDRGSDVPADAEGEKRAIEHIRTIASWRCVDFIEITGGNYENPGEFLFFELFFYTELIQIYQ